MIHMKACERLQVAPAFRFLENMQTSELALMHYGLGSQVCENYCIKIPDKYAWNNHGLLTWPHLEKFVSLHANS